MEIRLGRFWLAALAAALVARSGTVSAQLATTSLSTTPTPASPVAGQPMGDNATLSGGNNPTGTITFIAYPPGDATSCFTSGFVLPSVTVNGNGTYASPAFTPPLAGTWGWTAFYTGDANNSSAQSGCGAELAIVAPASPVLTTLPTATAIAGSTITDTATLSGGADPTGQIDFNLYGPSDATCSGSPFFQDSIFSVNGNGSYPSDPITTGGTGTYHWTVSYLGDSNNNPATSACLESTLVTLTVPALATSATAAAAPGQPILDTATLSGGNSPAGSISFASFPPGDMTCAGPPEFTSTVSVTGNGVYSSGSFVPTAAGTYRWTASYSGDANNDPVTGPCNAPGESSFIGPPVPAVGPAGLGVLALLLAGVGILLARRLSSPG